MGDMPETAYVLLHCIGGMALSSRKGVMKKLIFKEKKKKLYYFDREPILYYISFQQNKYFAANYSESNRFKTIVLVLFFCFKWLKMKTYRD